MESGHWDKSQFPPFRIKSHSNHTINLHNQVAQSSWTIQLHNPVAQFSCTIQSQVENWNIDVKMAFHSWQNHFALKSSKMVQESFIWIWAENFTLPCYSRKWLWIQNLYVVFYLASNNSSFNNKNTKDFRSQYEIVSQLTLFTTYIGMYIHDSLNFDTVSFLGLQSIELFGKGLFINYVRENREGQCNVWRMCLQRNDIYWNHNK